MFVHTVFFWLRRGISTKDETAFRAGLASLTGVDSIVHSWIGAPSATDRSVIDSSWQYSMTSVFKDRAAQEHYQDHPIHLAFVEHCQQYWQRVVVYDAVGSPSEDVFKPAKKK